MSDDRTFNVDDAAPTSLRHIVGQSHVVDQVTVALDAAFADNEPMPHALLAGPPGVGKTALAQVISREMASELHSVLGQSIATPADLNAVLLAAKHKDIVFIDEAHELDKSYQTSLYLALDQHRVLIDAGRSGNGPTGIPLCDFTLLLATTDEFRLLQPLRDRMRLTLRFGFYSIEELVELLRMKCRSLGWSVPDELRPQIAVRSRGTPRLALRLLQSCRRVCRADGESAISLQHLERACALEQIDELGLGPTEQRYLAAVADGASRLNVIASTLGLPSRTVAEVTEPFLIRAGLIVKDDRGRRQLTARGRKHVLEVREAIGREVRA
ncbi:MAG: Holliday junction DNA helicase RuvB C-terminal domain-containing protein [Planctomycetales bacterium]